MKRDNAQSVIDTEGTMTLSKTEAVWRAIEVLGYQAEVPQILDYVREHFGIDAATETIVPERTVEPAPAVQAAALPSVAGAPAAPAPTAAVEPVRKPASQPRPRPRNRSNPPE